MTSRDHRAAYAARDRRKLVEHWRESTWRKDEKARAEGYRNATRHRELRAQREAGRLPS
jgi:hypothetical protein